MTNRCPRSQASNPAVVAQHLCDLLQTFPAAAFEGVQWQTLVRKFEERHTMKLDLAALGYDSALQAASSLLFEVVRIVNDEDADNPVVAVEHGVALTPLPGYLACWPSLYVAMCEAVRGHGVFDDQGEVADGIERPRGLLLSQLKPLLQSKWHANFSECGLNYLSEDGHNVQMKKMKHLVTGVLRWRTQYVKRRPAQSRRNTLDAALMGAQLDLVPAKKHNDLVLQYSPPSSGDSQLVAAPRTPSPAAEASPPTPAASQTSSSTRWADVDVSEADDLWSDVEVKSTSTSVSRDVVHENLERELQNLRAENACLRVANSQLQQHSMSKNFFNIPTFTAPVDEPEIFDDPFEPPPEARTGGSSWILTPTSTATPSCNFSCSGSSVGTPISSAQSGTATPTVPGAVSPMAMHVQLCAFVPVYAQIPHGIVQKAKTFFEFEKSDEAGCMGQSTPPARGIVQRAKSFFEKSDEAIPSFYVRPNPSFFLRP